METSPLLLVRTEWDYTIDDSSSANSNWSTVHYNEDGSFYTKRIEPEQPAVYVEKSFSVDLEIRTI